MVPKLCEGPKSNMTQKEGLRTIKITKNVCSKVFDFCKSLNMHEQILASPREHFCVLLFHLYNEQVLTVHSQHKKNLK